MEYDIKTFDKSLKAVIYVWLRFEIKIFYNLKDYNDFKKHNNREIEQEDIRIIQEGDEFPFCKTTLYISK